MNSEQNSNNNGIFGNSSIPTVPENGLVSNMLVNSNNVNSEGNASENNVLATDIPRVNLSSVGGGSEFVAAPSMITGTESSVPEESNILVSNSVSSNLSEPNNDMGVENSLTNGEILTVNSNTIIPESSHPVNSSMQQTPVNSTSMAELRIDSSNPFDIGLNTTGTGHTLTPTISIDSNISSSSVSNVSPIMEDKNNSFHQEIGNLGNLLNSKSVPLTNPDSSSERMNFEQDSVVSVGKYLGYIVLFSIPIVGFIMLLVKAFGDKKDKNISNLAKAQLLLVVISIVLVVVVSIVFGSLLTSILPYSTGM